MESFRLVCRDSRGEWYMHDVNAPDATAAFEAATALELSPHVVVPTRLGRGSENVIVQRWKLGAVEVGDCLNCGYDLAGLIRAADSFALCPECGVGVVMKPRREPLEQPVIAAPNFKPGATLDSWGITFSVVGILFFPLAVLGIVLGAFAYEHSRGLRGVWAMRIGAAATIIGILLLLAGVFRF